MPATDPTRDVDIWMYVEGPARKVLRTKLLRCRDRLAAAAAEHHAHDLIGAELLWLAAEATEARLRDVFPDTWADHHKGWATADAAQIHTAGDPRHNRCRLCSPHPEPLTATAVSRHAQDA